MLSLLLFDLRTRVKPLLVWVVSWLALAGFMAWMFEPLREQVDTQTLLELFDPELLEAFNIPLDYLDSIENFVGGEFLTFYALIGGIFAVFAGVGRIRAKITDKTLSHLLSSQFTRTQIFVAGLLSNMLFFSTAAALIGCGMYWLFDLITNQDSISVDFFVASFVSLTIVHVAIVAAAQTAGIILRRNAVSLGTGLVIFTWFTDSLSTLDGFPDWLKPVSPFWYVNMEKITQDYQLDWGRLSVVLVFLISVSVAGVFLFRKKNIQF